MKWFSHLYTCMLCGVAREGGDSSPQATRVFPSLKIGVATFLFSSLKWATFLCFGGEAQQTRSQHRLAKPLAAPLFIFFSDKAIWRHALFMSHKNSNYATVDACSDQMIWIQPSSCHIDLLSSLALDFKELKKPFFIFGETWIWVLSRRVYSVSVLHSWTNALNIGLFLLGITFLTRSP